MRETCNTLKHLSTGFLILKNSICDFIRDLVSEHTFTVILERCSSSVVVVSHLSPKWLDTPKKTSSSISTQRYLECGGDLLQISGPVMKQILQNAFLEKDDISVYRRRYFQYHYMTLTCISKPKQVWMCCKGGSR